MWTDYLIQHWVRDMLLVMLSASHAFFLLIGHMSIELRAETVLSASVGSVPWNEIPKKRPGTNSQM